MKSSYSQFLASSRHVLGGKHGSVGGGFITIGLDFHSSSDTDEGFSAGEIGYMDEGVVEGSEEVGDGEDFLSFDGLWGEFGVCFGFTVVILTGVKERIGRSE